MRHRSSSDAPSSNRHDPARWQRSARNLSRLSPRPRTVPATGTWFPLATWFPATQVHKEVRPRCSPWCANTGSGALPTPHHLHEEGADVPQRTRSLAERLIKTGHSSVTTPLTQPAPDHTPAEPSPR